MSTKVSGSSNVQQQIAQLQAQEQQALQQLDATQAQTDQVLTDVENALPAAKTLVDGFKKLVDGGFSLERSAIEAKLAEQLKALNADPVADPSSTATPSTTSTTPSTTSTTPSTPSTTPSTTPAPSTPSTTPSTTPTPSNSSTAGRAPDLRGQVGRHALRHRLPERRHALGAGGRQPADQELQPHLPGPDPQPPGRLQLHRDPAPAPSSGTPSSGSGIAAGSGKDASAVARQYLGWTEYKLEPSGQLDMDTWVAKNVDCANFVSGCLEKAGLISHAQRSDNVSGLASHLRSAGWQDVPLANAKPGDVVCFDGPEGNYQHVEIFDHWQGSTPVFIGSNNVLSDGTQEITYDVGGKWAHGFHVLAPPA